MYLENTLDSHTTYTGITPDNICNILARTDIHRNSFLPLSIRLWNTLHFSIPDAYSLNTFKSSLDLVYDIPKMNQYYSIGSRSVNTILSSMRIKCSQLKIEIFQNGILLQVKCTCGFSIRNTIPPFLLM